MNIGLTGGIATGKSTVSSLLVKKGALLVDADTIAREVMLPGQPVLAAVTDFFGQAILQADGTLDRKKLGKIVFNDPMALQALNEMSHPEIRKQIKERMNDLEKLNPNLLVVVDNPLLIESGYQSMFEQVMVVYVPRDIQKQRLILRDSLTDEEAEARLHAQVDIEEKKKQADIIIDNSNSIEETKQQLDQFWLKLGLL